MDEVENHFGEHLSFLYIIRKCLMNIIEMIVYKFLNREIYGFSFYQFRNRYFDMVGYSNHIPRFKSYMTDEGRVSES